LTIFSSQIKHGADRCVTPDLMSMGLETRPAKPILLCHRRPTCSIGSTFDL